MVRSIVIESFPFFSKRQHSFLLYFLSISLPFSFSTLLSLYFNSHNTIFLNLCAEKKRLNYYRTDGVVHFSLSHKVNLLFIFKFFSPCGTLLKTSPREEVNRELKNYNYHIYLFFIKTSLPTEISNIYEYTILFSILKRYFYFIFFFLTKGKVWQLFLYTFFNLLLHLEFTFSGKCIFAFLRGKWKIYFLNLHLFIGDF